VEGVEVMSIVKVVVDGTMLDEILLDAEVELVVEDEVLVEPNTVVKSVMMVFQ
jgi:hypothetical protein